MLDLPSTSLFSCATCEVLFRPPGLSVWNKRPFSSDVQSSGATCSRCRLVYAGASAALLGVKTWDHVRLLAFLVVGREQDGGDPFLRVGALDYGPVPSVDHPRPWVDFYINPSNGRVNGEFLSLVPVFHFPLFGFSFSRQRLGPEKADGFIACCVYQLKPEPCYRCQLLQARTHGIEI